MPSYFLGVDIGTGSSKAVALDINGKSIFSSQVFYDTLQFQAGYFEQRPDEIFAAFVKSISDVVHHLKENPAAVSLSSAMHSIVPVDRNGHPLTNLLTWADARSADIAERIKASPEAESLYKATGTPIHAMSPLCKIIWWKENQPELFARTFKFISIKEYIWNKLFHHFQIDYSIASATGLFDIRELNWNKKALQLAGISADQLSTPVSPSLARYDLTEAIAAALHIDASTPFVIGASDGCLANLGSSAMSGGLASITIGTSGAVRMASHKAIDDFAAMLFNYRLDENIFISGGAINNGGIAVKWCAENLLHEKLKGDYELFFQQANSIKAGSEGLIFLPYIMGERAPVWDSKASGIFFGLKVAHTSAHFLRAVAEGICFSLYDVLQKLEALAGNIEKIHVSGGLFKSRVFTQLLASITGKKIYLMQTEDASAIGAVYLALKALGHVESFEELPLQEAIYLTEPGQEDHKIYQKHFQIYRNLYDRLKDLMREL